MAGAPATSRWCGGAARAGAVVATAELGREVVDQAPIDDGRFTLIAVDAVKGLGDDDYLEIQLWDRRVNQLAAESLYDQPE